MRGGLIQRLATWLAVLLTVLLTGAVDLRSADAAVAPSARVGDGVLDALATQSSVRTLVLFALPASARSLAPRSQARRAAIADARARVLAQTAVLAIEPYRSFASVPAFAAELDASAIAALAARDDVVRIGIDEPGQGGLLQALPLMDFDAVTAAGFTGDGVTVAVIDSGYDSDHADLADDVVGEACFCTGGCCPSGGNTQFGPGAAEDDHGHGTNVAGIVTSAGAVAPAGGAADAEFVAIKVLDASNSFCCTSDVVAALDHVIDNLPDVDIVNMSLGTFSLFSGECDGASAATMALATAIDTLAAAGVTTFASSMNNGSGTQMGAPACVAAALSVGAVSDSTDQVTSFSNSNATTDLFAAGQVTTSTGIGGGTSSFSGTSQASPAAAACAANLLEAVPTLTPNDIELALEASPTFVTDSTNGLSFPRVDCDDALALVLSAGNCGNGALDPFEQCDDGGTADGDCCSAGCLFEASSSPCADDGDLCPGASECNGTGECVSSAGVCADEDPCTFDLCEPLLGCANDERPHEGCFEAGKAQVDLSDRDGSAKDRLRWKWKRGAAFGSADTGAAAAADYALCVYDTTATMPSLAARLEVGPHVGWTDRSSGLRYKDKDASQSGVTQIDLSGRAAGKSKAAVKAEGPGFVPPGAAGAAYFAADPEVVVQLVGPGGACWSSTFTTFKRNDAERYKAKSP